MGLCFQMNPFSTHECFSSFYKWIRSAFVPSVSRRAPLSQQGAHRPCLRAVLGVTEARGQGLLRLFAGGDGWDVRGSEVEKSEISRCPPLTCLYAGNTGGIKHALPLGRTQGNLVGQQVNLIQRPTAKRQNSKNRTHNVYQVYLCACVCGGYICICVFK